MWDLQLRYNIGVTRLYTDPTAEGVLALLLTRPCSLQRVSMTRVCTFFSQIILQKSLTVPGKGPWAAINSFLELWPCQIQQPPPCKHKHPASSVFQEVYQHFQTWMRMMVEKKLDLSKRIRSWCDVYRYWSNEQQKGFAECQYAPECS